MKYINNKQENGIAYDYKMLRKEFKKLKIPKEFYDPSTAPHERAAWMVEVSERSTGKTTGWLLWALLLFWHYGTLMHYVRSSENMILPKNSKNLYETVIANKYIEKITKGEYNNIQYKSRRWFLTHVGDDGIVDKVHPDPCTYMCSVDKAGNLKSVHNAPKGDLVIFDEFIPLFPRQGCDFVPFCDLVKTIFRDRLAGKIVLLANTINKEDQYFHELEIYERISEMCVGERAIHTTDKGTNIYIEIVGIPVTLKSRKRAYNKMFLGFTNPLLSGITGDSTWSVHNYPHVPEIPFKSLARNIYISHNNKLVNLEIVSNEIGVCIYAHWSTQTHEDSLKLIASSPVTSSELYGIGDNTTLGKFIRETAKNRNIYFASNDVGSFVNNYFIQCGVALPLL